MLNEGGGHGGGGSTPGDGSQMEWWQGLSDESVDGAAAGAVCLYSPGAAPCCSTAPCLWRQMKLLSRPHLWCPSHCLLHPHCLSHGCRSPEGGPVQSWTKGEGCDWLRAMVAEEEGLEGKSDLAEEEDGLVLQQISG